MGNGRRLGPELFYSAAFSRLNEMAADEQQAAKKCHLAAMVVGKLDHISVIGY